MDFEEEPDAPKEMQEGDEGGIGEGTEENKTASRRAVAADIAPTENAVASESDADGVSSPDALAGPRDDSRLRATMSAKAKMGAEEPRVVFRIPRDAAGNVAQPDMSLGDILSRGEMYSIRAFVDDMNARKERKDVLAGGIFCAAGHPMVAAYGKEKAPYFRHNTTAKAKRTTGADKADTACPPCGCASVMSHEHLDAQRLLCAHPNRVQITRFKDCGKCVADVFAPGQVAYARREVPERGGRIRTDVVFYDAVDQVLMRIEVRHTHRSEEGTRTGLVWCEVYAEHILAAFRASGEEADAVVCLAAEPTGERPHCMPCAAAADKEREDARREKEAATERTRAEWEAAAERARRATAAARWVQEVASARRAVGVHGVC